MSLLERGFQPANGASDSSFEGMETVMTQVEQRVYPHYPNVDEQPKKPLNTKELAVVVDELWDEIRHLREQNELLRKEIHRKK